MHVVRPVRSVPISASLSALGPSHRPELLFSSSPALIFKIPLEMKVPMGPPPPRNPNPNREPELSNAERSLGEALQPSAPEKSRTDEESSTPLEEPDKEEPHQNPNPNPSSSPSERGGKSPVPYSIPPWSEPPTHRFFLEVLKDGSIIEQLDVSSKDCVNCPHSSVRHFCWWNKYISKAHPWLLRAEEPWFC